MDTALWFLLGYFLMHSPGQVGSSLITPLGGWSFPGPRLTHRTQREPCRQLGPHGQEGSALRPVSYSNSSAGLLPSAVTPDEPCVSSVIFVSGIFSLHSLKFLCTRGQVCRSLGFQFCLASMFKVKTGLPQAAWASPGPSPSLGTSLLPRCPDIQYHGTMSSAHVLCPSGIPVCYHLGFPPGSWADGPS